MSGLTDAQRAAREGKMTASRIGKLMTGTEADIVAMWEVMTGRADEPDLSGVWPVYLGTHSEALHLGWLAHVWGAPITRQGESVTHNAVPWAACTLDGWFDGCPVEVKHVGGFEKRDAVIARYYPQVQWQMFVTGAMRGHLSLIEGAREPVVTMLERDEEYIAEMMDRASAFMRCVESDTPPFELPEPPTQHITALRFVNLDDAGTEQPNWAEDMRAAIARWLATSSAVKTNKAAFDTIKTLLPDDVGDLACNGVMVKRAKNNAIHVREPKE